MASDDDDDPPGSNALGDGIAEAVGQHAAAALSTTIGPLAVPGGVITEKLTSALIGVATGPSLADRRLAAEERRSATDASYEVHGLKGRVSAIELSVERVRVDGQRLREMMERRDADHVGEVLVRQLAAGGLTLDEALAEPHLERAVDEAWRAMMRRHATDAARPLAALAARYAGRPIDPLFRTVSRVLSDVDDEQLDELRRATAGAVDARATFDTPTSLELFTRFPAPGSQIEECSWWMTASGLRWKPIVDATGARLSSRRGALALMLRHGVLIEPGLPKKHHISSADAPERLVAELPGPTLDLLVDLLELPGARSG